MKFPLIPFNSRQFSYTHGDKTLISEASDLDNLHLQRLYDDACDVGFAVQSDQTGNVVVFVMSEAKSNGEGELTHWLYEPTAESIRKYPECVGMKAIVFND